MINEEDKARLEKAINDMDSALDGFSYIDAAFCIAQLVCYLDEQVAKEHPGIEPFSDYVKEIIKVIKSTK